MREAALKTLVTKERCNLGLTFKIMMLVADFWRFLHVHAVFMAKSQCNNSISKVFSL